MQLMQNLQTKISEEEVTLPTPSKKTELKTPDFTQTKKSQKKRK
jgi:hypothetical protein